MNIKRFSLAVLASFIFIFILETLVHGMLLQDLYSGTKELWRTAKDAMMGFVTISQLLFSFVVGLLFIKMHNKGCSLRDGLKFGLLVGLLVFSLEFATYAYMPVPFMLWFTWIVTGLFKGLGAGTIMALVYKK